MDNDPIKEQKTFIEKIKELYEKYILKPPTKNNYFITPYELECNIGSDTDHEWEKLNKKWADLADIMRVTGASCSDMRNALIQFSNIKTK